jgi:hypothetical protein
MLLTRSRKFGVSHFVSVELDEEKFICQVNNKKQDVSEIWQEVLGNVNQV